MKSLPMEAALPNSQKITPMLQHRGILITGRDGEDHFKKGFWFKIKAGTDFKPQTYSSISKI